MSRILIAAALLIATAATATATTAHAATREWQPLRFDRVALAGSYTVTVVPGAVASVRAEGDPEALERIEVRVEDGQLRLGSRRDSWNWGWSRHGRVRMTVVSPVPLRAAALAGSGDMTIARVSVPSFEAKLAGSGDLVLRQVDVREIAAHITGSGDLTASGHAEHVEGSIAGSGDLHLGDLHAADFTGSISGSGDIAAFASRTATLSIVGSGDARVRGGARCTVSKRGSGSAICTA